MSWVVRSPNAPGCQRAATRETSGIASLRIPRRLGTSSGPRKVDPVIFAPGRARLAVPRPDRRHHSARHPKMRALTKPLRDQRAFLRAVPGMLALVGPLAANAQ